jgi:hypothetical protein
VGGVSLLAASDEAERRKYGNAVLGGAGGCAGVECRHRWGG